MDAMSRQQAAIRDAQRQVLGNKAVPTLKPSGTFSAPSVPSQSSLVFKGGGVHFHSPVRANLLTAIAGVASQTLVEPLSDAISDNIVFPLLEKALGRDIPSAAEIRRRQQQGEQVPTVKDAVVDASPEASVSPLNPLNAFVDEIEDSAPVEAIVEEAPMPETHSPPPEDDERNREYLIRRAALGENPTQEEMRAVVAYGLEQHQIHFPNLYD